MKRSFVVVLLAFWALTVVAPRTQADTRYLVTQTGSSDCGPAALATLLRYYLDVPTDETEMMRLAKLDRNTGTSLLSLEEAATAKLCMADSFRMNFDLLRKQLDSYSAPVIVRLLLPQPHFMLLLAASEDYVYLADPASGNIVLPTKTFLKRWIVPEPPATTAAEKAAPPEKKGFVFVVATPMLHVNEARKAQIIRDLDRQLQNLEASPRIQRGRAGR